MAHADPQESEAESQKVDGKDGEAEPLGNCGKIVVVKTRVLPGKSLMTDANIRIQSMHQL